ncbi:putative ATP-dependent DNA helicase HFM1 [Grifola frondosa]|uniref:Putative ATP-dependent DNA helicase HFM1 n=1 Tax=Grifola frondosa TaxID=5627 RepID=A0A1C7LWP7_GRIFR|nr:putative ATP-dependent DNA helicase HFM1 [Grifola frondosa]
MDRHLFSGPAYGYDNNVIDYGRTYENSAPFAFQSKAVAQDIYDDYNDEIDDLIEEFENSSPSPPERRHASNSWGSQQHAYQPSTLVHYDEVEQYATQSMQDEPFVSPAASTQDYHTSRLYQPSSYPKRNVPQFRSYQQPNGASESSARLSSYKPPSAPADESYEEASKRGDIHPRNWHGVRLRPVSDLPDIYRGVFKFGVFNAVQSQCFDTVMHTDKNMSLCSEKFRDWTTKFQSLGVNCCELTGDTVQFGKSAWGNAKDASVIITTGEKWDSLTRNWRGNGQILSQVQLFLIDEASVSGRTLEVIISRMKTRGSSVRFVVVSATVPNIEDVANWIGDDTSDGSATVMQFGEEFRPCKLSKFVYGIPRRKDANDFVYARTLDFKLYGILQQRSVNKPMLVFCATRKGVMSTAEQMMKEYEEGSNKKETLPWSRPQRIEHSFHNKQLEKLASCGIGVHHAGMTIDDRRATEDLYLKKILRILFATSTLAVGVNLPAHTVVIKGVKIFTNNTSQEYSDLDIMQMMGRAGRPQFDKEGVAIILCEPELEAKYNALVQGRSVLESSLHLNLSEHINSEIGLGTITNLHTAKQWLQNSTAPKQWQARIEDMVMQSVAKLKESELVTCSEEDTDSLCSTDFGDIMSKVRQYSMSLILKLPERATVREILEMIACAEEFTDIKIRSGEKQVYNKMRTHNDIRFPIKKVEKPSDKIFILIQAVLGGISLSDPEYRTSDSQPNSEALGVFRHISRLSRAVVEVAITKKSGAQIKNGLEVMRCVTAKAWEDRPVMLRQLEAIGEKSIKVALGLFAVFTVALKEAKTFVVTAQLTKPSQSVTVSITSEMIAGLTVSATFKPSVDPKHYPVMDTRPLDAVATTIEGLENTNFWDMSDDEEITEDIPIKDITQPRKATYPPVNSRSQKLSPRRDLASPAIRDNMSELPLAPKRLPNGQYEQGEVPSFMLSDGLSKRPPMSKKQVQALTAFQGQPASTSSDSKSPLANSVFIMLPEHTAHHKLQAKSNHRSSSKQDISLKHLETLHDRANVKENLKLPEGRRIKLEDPTPTTTKRRKLAPNFDLDFVRLQDEQTVTLDIADLHDSDDELPEASEILDAYRTPRRKPAASSDDLETNYSNSEIDALIRDLPLHGSKLSSSSAPIVCTASQSGPRSPQLLSGRLTPAQIRKRKQESASQVPTNKRVRRSSTAREYPSPPPASLKDLHSAQMKGKGRREPLFVTSSDEEEDIEAVDSGVLPPEDRASSSPAESQDNEGFTLNYALLDILPSHPL